MDLYHSLCNVSPQRGYRTENMGIYESMQLGYWS